MVAIRAWQVDKLEYMRTCLLDPDDAVLVAATKQFVHATYNQSGQPVETAFLAATGIAVLSAGLARL